MDTKVVFPHSLIGLVWYRVTKGLQSINIKFIPYFKDFYSQLEGLEPCYQAEYIKDCVNWRGNSLVSQAPVEQVLSVQITKDSSN